MQAQGVAVSPSRLHIGRIRMGQRQPQGNMARWLVMTGLVWAGF